MREFSIKAGRQMVKDYVAFPALTLLSPWATYTSTLTADALANVIRNVWSNAVIFCGHFPDGAEKFTKTDMVGETKGEWYLRQMLGSANFEAGPALRFMSGNLCHQIEHHLYPGSAEQPAARDLNPGQRGLRQVRPALHHRLVPDAVRQDVADHRQVVAAGQVTCATPPTMLRRPAASGCLRNWGLASGVTPASGRRRGLKTAIATVRGWRRAKRAEKRTPKRTDLAA